MPTFQESYQAKCKHLSSKLLRKYCRNRENQALLGVANAFSGGIFLAISVIHILPEVTEDYRAYVLHEMEEEAHEHSHGPVFHEATPGKIEEIFIDHDSSSDHHHRFLHGSGADGVHLGFPWPSFIVFCGYSIILLIDKVAFAGN